MIKDILFCVSNSPELEYKQLQFSEVNLVGGAWRNLLIRFRLAIPSHGRLHATLLQQLLSFTSVSRPTDAQGENLPWFEPPYVTPGPFGNWAVAMPDRTPLQVATLIKRR